MKNAATVSSASGARRFQEFAQQPPLAFQAKKAAPEQRGRRAGQLAVAAAAQHVAALAHGGRVLHLVVKAQLVKQFGQLGAELERVGARFEQVAFGLVQAEQVAAGPCLGLK
nr:hypothetical protein [Hymenobacter coccineus]